jgi:hypothetical protein
MNIIGPMCAAKAEYQTVRAIVCMLVLATSSPTIAEAQELSAASALPVQAAEPSDQSKNVAIPSFTVSANSLKFEDHAIGTASDPISIQVTAPSAVSLSTSASPADGSYIVSPSACQPTAAQPCRLSVTFNPKSEGPIPGTLLVSDTAKHQIRVSLLGQGIPCMDPSGCRLLKRLWLIPVIAFAYLIGLVVVRWNMIALPTRRLLRAQIQSLRSQVATFKLRSRDKDEELDLIDKMLTEADKHFEASWINPMEFLFWSRGSEISGWGLAHESEAHLAVYLSPDEVRASLERLSSDLKQRPEMPAGSMVQRIQDGLANASGATTSAERWKALLFEARGMYYDYLDTDFATLVSWQNKTSWLVTLGLGLIIVLAVTLHHEALFLVGATGGLLSRLSRSLNRADVPTDYGASWTTLFLSPVVGALAGWSGLLLVALAVKLNVLGNAFTSVTWCDGDDCAPTSLALAFLLGFSERAFDEILNQLETKLQGTAKTTTAASALRIATTALPLAPINVPYQTQLSGTGGQPPYRWTRTQGALPPGLNLVDNTIKGTATGPAGVATFTVQISDTASASDSKELTIIVTTTSNS